MLTSNFSFCQGAKKLTLESLKLELAEFLVEKNQIKSNDKRVSFRGIYKNRVDENLISGIYVFNNGSTHSLSFFVIVDNNSYIILDISTLQGLKDSIEKTLEFANKQNYCTEIIEDYINRLIAVHFTVNRNPRTLWNKNCEFEIKPTKSTFLLSSLKTKLAGFLIEKKEIKDFDNYLKYTDFLIVDKVDIYSGIDENKNMNCGIYSFGFIDPNQEKDTKLYFVVLNKDWFEIFDIAGQKKLSAGINLILDFAENQKYCHKKTQQIIAGLIYKENPSSCFDNPIFDLP